MIRDFQGIEPQIHSSCFIAETAAIIGRVTLAENVNVWYGVVLRGDDNYIQVGKNTNIQDNTVLHIAKDFPCIVGENVTIGHGAIVHACTIGNNVLVGMGSIVLNGAVVEENVIIGAGALVPQGKVIPKNSLVLGSPAKVVRQLTESEIQNLQDRAEAYTELANKY